MLDCPAIVRMYPVSWDETQQPGLEITVRIGRWGEALVGVPERHSDGES